MRHHVTSGGMFALASLLFVSGLALSPISVQAASTYYVAPNGSDANPGTIALPLKTLVKAHAVAQAGDTITVRDGVYRESIVITKSNLTIQGYPGETPIIKGSDVITNWVQEPGKNVWSASVRIHNAGISPSTIQPSGVALCNNSQTLCRFPYQVFVNGANLAKVNQGTDPGPGQFTWSDTSQNPTMRIGTDPTGNQVEVSVRNQWITGALPPGSSNPYDLPNNVTIRGLTFRHSVAGFGQGGIELGPWRESICQGQSDLNGCMDNTGTGWTIEQNDIGWAHAVGIVLRSSKHTIQNNTIHHNTPTGIGGQTKNTAITTNTIHDNNKEGVSLYFGGGAMRINQSSFVTVSNNTVHDNAGLGLTFDILCSDVTIANNRIYRNADAGIIYEISTRATIKDNIVFDNGTQGIFIANSDNSTVISNIVARNLFSNIWLLQDDRSTKFQFPDTQNNVIQNNTAIGDGQNPPLAVIGAFYNGGQNLLNTNTVNNNKVFRYGSTPTLYSWITKAYNLPAGLCEATGGQSGGGKECNSTILTQSQADQVLVANLIPPTPAGGATPPLPSSRESAPSPRLILTRNLHIGMRGREVETLQGALQAFGFFPKYVQITGYFGSLTEQAVQKFQRAEGISPTGYVGPLTREALSGIPVPVPLPRSVETPRTPEFVPLPSPRESSSATPSITSLTPVKGRVGTEVVIRGENFAQDNNAVQFGKGYTKNLKSQGNKRIVFIVPESLNPCPPDAQACIQSVIATTPGIYEVAVLNAQGKSAPRMFTVR